MQNVELDSRGTLSRVAARYYKHGQPNGSSMIQGSKLINTKQVYR
jgi:hypothetical protein